MLSTEEERKGKGIYMELYFIVLQCAITEVTDSIQPRSRDVCMVLNSIYTICAITGQNPEKC